MQIDIKHLESLSKLKIEDDKKEKFEKDLEKILAFVDEITKLDLPEEKKSGVSISSLREDKAEVQKDFDPLLNAPKQKDGCYKVPLVVE